MMSALEIPEGPPSTKEGDNGVGFGRWNGTLATRLLFRLGLSPLSRADRYVKIRNGPLSTSPTLHEEFPIPIPIFADDEHRNRKKGASSST